MSDESSRSIATLKLCTFHNHFPWIKTISVKRIVLNAITILGSYAVNRNERNILRSQGQNFRDGSHEFDQHMFDVSEETCIGDGWGEKIDNWDILTRNLDGTEYGKHKENIRKT